MSRAYAVLVEVQGGSLFINILDMQRDAAILWQRMDLPTFRALMWCDDRREAQTKRAWTHANRHLWTRQEAQA